MTIELKFYKNNNSEIKKFDYVYYKNIGRNSNTIIKIYYKNSFKILNSVVSKKFDLDLEKWINDWDISEKLRLSYDNDRKLYLSKQIIKYYAKDIV